MKKTTFIPARLILALAMTFATLTASAQEYLITQSETTYSDMERMHEFEGYETFSFDLSNLLDDLYNISIIVKEYVNGEEVSDQHSISTLNKMMISEFPEEVQKEVLAEGSADDPENGIYRKLERLQVAFYPTDREKKTRSAMFSLCNMSSTRWDFDLKTVKNGEREISRYFVQPFKPQPLNSSDFHPLLLFSSMWFDSTTGLLNSCTERLPKPDIYRVSPDRQYAPDLSSPMLKECPHYFVIGITVVKMK